jgi:hypothetical protein
MPRHWTSSQRLHALRTTAPRRQPGRCASLAACTLSRDGDAKRCYRYSACKICMCRNVRSVRRARARLQGTGTRLAFARELTSAMAAPGHPRAPHAAAADSVHDDDLDGGNDAAAPRAHAALCPPLQRRRLSQTRPEIAAECRRVSARASRAALPRAVPLRSVATRHSTFCLPPLDTCAAACRGHHAASAGDTSAAADAGVPTAVAKGEPRHGQERLRSPLQSRTSSYDAGLQAFAPTPAGMQAIPEEGSLENGVLSAPVATPDLPGRGAPSNRSDMVTEGTVKFGAASEAPERANMPARWSQCTNAGDAGKGSALKAPRSKDGGSVESLDDAGESSSAGTTIVAGDDLDEESPWDGIPLLVAASTQLDRAAIA